MTASVSPLQARLPARAARPSPGRCGFQEALQRAEQASPRSRSLRRPPLRAPCERQPEARPPPSAAPAIAPAPPSISGPPPGIPELQAALRAAPAAIATAAGGPAQLALSFGTALSVELRAGAQGLELSLRPAPSLERAARAELPRLVEALRARGLRVAQADVRSTPAAGAPARAR